MEANAKYLVVGISLLAMIVVSTAAILWLAKFGNQEKQDYYAIYFREQSLSGLQANAIVTMKGIPVGNVSSLKISPTDIEKILVVINVTHDTPVKITTQAIVQRNLLTGLAGLDLANSTQAAPRLQPGGMNDDNLPIIKEGKGQFDMIKTSAPEVLERANQILGRVELFLSDDNRIAFEGAVKNFSKLSEQLASGPDSLTAIMKDVKNLTGTTSGALNGVRDTLGTVDKELPNLAQIFGSVAQDISRSVNKASTSIAAAAQGFQNPRAILTGPGSDAMGPGEKSR